MEMTNDGVFTTGLFAFVGKSDVHPYGLFGYWMPHCVAEKRLTLLGSPNSLIDRHLKGNLVLLD